MLKEFFEKMFISKKEDKIPEVPTIDEPYIPRIDCNEGDTILVPICVKITDNRQRVQENVGMIASYWKDAFPKVKIIFAPHTDSTKFYYPMVLGKTDPRFERLEKLNMLNIEPTLNEEN